MWFARSYTQWKRLTGRTDRQSASFDIFKPACRSFWRLISATATRRTRWWFTGLRGQRRHPRHRRSGLHRAVEPRIRVPETRRAPRTPSTSTTSKNISARCRCIAAIAARTGKTAWLRRRRHDAQSPHAADSSRRRDRRSAATFRAAQSLSGEDFRSAWKNVMF